MPFDTWRKFMDGLPEGINDTIMEKAIPLRRRLSNLTLPSSRILRFLYLHGRNT